MTMSKIGLKLANGEFYPVLDDSTSARKRLVVTTVQDGQRSVQIDIYRGGGPTVASAEYVGSLVIDNIPFAPKGEPDIRLDLGLDANGKLEAYAEDMASGEHQSIELSLQALAEENKYEIPDFAFEEETDSLPADADADLTAAAAAVEQSYSGAEIAAAASEAAVGEERPRRKLPVILLIALLALLAALGCAYLVYRCGVAPRSARVEKAPAVTQPEPTPAPQAAVAAPEPAPVEPAPTTAAAPAAAPAAEPAAAPKPAGGFDYKLKWGDTLWELSYTFYQNPWYFGKIAKANKIKNPDHIIAGHTIWIPPR